MFYRKFATVIHNNPKLTGCKPNDENNLPDIFLLIIQQITSTKYYIQLLVYREIKHLVAGIVQMQSSALRNRVKCVLMIALTQRMNHHQGNTQYSKQHHRCSH